MRNAEWADKHPRKGIIDIEKACNWKPSKEQIAALACAMTYLRNKDTRAAAKSLYDDLKAL